ncbi:alpha/beta hydrolase [Nonomuraea sp. 3-1Str]|uniref:alpha/beta hydrolase n=1 Tax=Nonomuraea sp. 3-1Str TaxID=2929801 RepID=UPI002861F99C|nr:alpha/beta hydrolase [Nonomuraea sp. 3-1Str]MDR8413148.1 alpha/beta hydrolase [Nonomuraea sp. 3-1Str]
MLAGLMQAALNRAELPVPNTPEEAALQNTAAHAGATPNSIARHERQVKRNLAVYPLTAGMPVNLGPCDWPFKRAERATRISSRGPANVLLIQNRRDPSTPYSGALKMREAMMTDKFATDIVLEAAELFSHPSYPTLM